jgi:hypothetical protein
MMFLTIQPLFIERREKNVYQETRFNSFCPCADYWFAGGLRQLCYATNS